MTFNPLDNMSAIAAKSYAQMIAFAPIMFQAVRLLRDFGILAKIHECRSISEEDLKKAIDISPYAFCILMQAGSTSGVLTRKDNQISLSKVGYFILNDEMTITNMNFTHDICYQGMFSLEESLRNQQPEGLKVFGNWPTIYEGLSTLPDQAKKSWFAFDHFYSDQAFPQVLPLLFAMKPKSILDVGGNTGRFATQCVLFDASVKVCVLDLPNQLKELDKNVSGQSYADRISTHGIDLLDHSKTLPGGFDLIWMSQFLDCFGESDVIALLKRAAAALPPHGKVCVLEPFVDRQEFPAAEHSLVMTSFYFTAMANGVSRMYTANEMLTFAKAAGLTLEQETNQLGISHTLMVFAKSEQN